MKSPLLALILWRHRQQTIDFLPATQPPFLSSSLTPWSCQYHPFRLCCCLLRSPNHRGTPTTHLSKHPPFRNNCPTTPPYHPPLPTFVKRKPNGKIHKLMYFFVLLIRCAFDVSALLFSHNTQTEQKIKNKIHS